MFIVYKCYSGFMTNDNAVFPPLSYVPRLPEPKWFADSVELPLRSSGRERRALKYEPVWFVTATTSFVFATMAGVFAIIFLHAILGVATLILVAIGSVSAIQLRIGNGVPILPFYLPDGRYTRMIDEDLNFLVSTKYNEVAEELYDEAVKALRKAGLSPSGLMWWASAGEHATALKELRQRAEAEQFDRELKARVLETSALVRAQIILASAPSFEQ